MFTSQDKDKKDVHDRKCEEGEQIVICARKSENLQG